MQADSAYAEQFHFEHQGRVRRDHAAGAARAVTECRWNGQFAFAPDLHSLHAFIPSADDLALSQPEPKGVVAILAGIRLAAVREPAGVVHRDSLTRSGDIAVANDELFDQKSTCGFGGDRKSVV